MNLSLAGTMQMERSPTNAETRRTRRGAENFRRLFLHQLVGAQKPFSLCDPLRSPRLRVSPPAFQLNACGLDTLSLGVLARPFPPLGRGPGWECSERRFRALNPWTAMAEVAQASAPASSRGVPPRVPRSGETPPELAAATAALHGSRGGGRLPGCPARKKFGVACPCSSPAAHGSSPRPASQHSITP